MRKCMMLIGGLVGLAACGGDGTVQPPDDEVSFSQDVQAIFSLNCASLGCHVAPDPQQGQDLSAGNAYDNIVNVPSMELPTMVRIAPGNPNGSYLFHKISDTHLSIGGSGERMPLPPRNPLSATDIATIRTWIVEGARNN